MFALCLGSLLFVVCVLGLLGTGSPLPLPPHPLVLSLGPPGPWPCLLSDTIAVSFYCNKWALHCRKLPLAMKGQPEGSIFEEFEASQRRNIEQLAWFFERSQAQR